MTINFLGNNAKNHGKQTLSVIALILLLAISSSMAAMPISKAQTSNSYPTDAYVACSPNPAGLGQTVTIEMWLAQVNPLSMLAAGSTWQNFMLLITNPDKTTQTLGPFKANDASFAVTTITPNQTGNYTLFFSFPGAHLVGFGYSGYVNAYYSGSNFTTTLTVQQQAATTTPQAPLPTSYWTRPINAQNSNWYTISGNWLGISAGSASAGLWQPYSQGPTTAHILWTKPLLFGGLIGGEFGGNDTSNYYTGKSYQDQFADPVIMNGVLYYNAPTQPYEGFYAVDLRTGQTLWFQNGTALEASGFQFGEVVNFITPDQEGGIPLLWSTGTGGFLAAASNIWTLRDANTGNIIMYIDNATGGTFVEGDNGALLEYMIGTSWVALWNSTKLLQSYSYSTLFGGWELLFPLGGTVNFDLGIEWNVTVPAVPGQTISKVDSNVVLATAGPGIFEITSIQTNIGYSATTGNQLWIQNVTIPSGPSNEYEYSMGPMANGVFTAYDAPTRQWYGFSETTGKQVWGPTTADPNAWASEYSSSGAAYGVLYAQTAADIDAYNITTGQFLWRFTGLNSGTDFPGFTTYPFEGQTMTISDGMIYAQTGDSHGDPLFRGAQLYCVNATTGQLIWNINDFGGGVTMPISEGELITQNMYDNQLYAYGMGPSKTTVSAPQVGVTTATPVTITGSVTDISAGASQEAVAANFPNGLPCVSDASMTQFMEAVYMQQPMPTNITGVPVTLTETDHNGNTYVMGTTTTNAYGTYGFNWTPPIPGNYTIVATFGGSGAYYGSCAETYLYASSPPATPAPTAAPPTGLASTSSLELGIAALAIIIIVCVAVLAVLMLRKRP